MGKPTGRNKTRWRRGVGIAAILFIAAAGFGISGSDETALRGFNAAVPRWQFNPEFRAVAREYCEMGSAAVRTRPCGLPTGGAVMALRSIPLLPKKFAVNPTSQLHYQNFGRGPLVAYLHLCSEQSVADVVNVIEKAGRTPKAEADLRGVLNSFKMDFPVAHDAGALQSAASLLRETEASRPFAVRTNVGDLLRRQIAALAQELHIDPDPLKMTPAQQQAILDHLDNYVRAHDAELWRAKQVNDFAGGVWAQVFGPPYLTILGPFLWVHDICRFALLGILAYVAWRMMRESRRLRTKIEEDQQSQKLIERSM